MGSYEDDDVKLDLVDFVGDIDEPVAAAGEVVRGCVFRDGFHCCRSCGGGLKKKR